MWGAGGDHDACFANLEASGAVHDADVSNLEMLVRFGAQTLHLGHRHRVVRFVDQIRSFALGPLTRVAVECNGGAAFR